MSNPWNTIPLDDYEAHMNSPGVCQLAPLSDLFHNALAIRSPQSIAILGVAGGNGLEHVDSGLTKRVVGIDLNSLYLNAVREERSVLGRHAWRLIGDPPTPVGMRTGGQ